jgi:hypothetical protein
VRFAVIKREHPYNGASLSQGSRYSTTSGRNPLAGAPKRIGREQLRSEPSWVWARDAGEVPWALPCAPECQATRKTGLPYCRTGGCYQNLPCRRRSGSSPKSIGGPARSAAPFKWQAERSAGGSCGPSEASRGGPKPPGAPRPGRWRRR